MNEALIGAIGLAIGGIITAAVAGWISLRRSGAELNKSKVEVDKTVRNGVLSEWREITERLQERVKEQGDEIKALRVEVTKLYGELAAVRAQIVTRETERIEQRGAIHALEKTVVDLKKPDTVALAEAIIPKLAEAMTAAVPSGNPIPVTAPEPLPVRVVPASRPLPVVETPDSDVKPKGK